MGQLYLPGDHPPYPTVCLCHGIPAEQFKLSKQGYRLLAEKIRQRGFAVFAFNFRGTGESSGNLDILGWTRDLKAAIDYLYRLPEVDKSHLSLLGFSGGAGVAICVAARDKRVSAVVSCASPAEFTRLTESYTAVSLAEHFHKIGTIRDNNFPPSAEEWFNNFKLVSPIKYVADIAPRPLLLVHGNKDDVVNISHAHRLYEKANQPKQLIIINRVGHRLRRSNKVLETAIAWLKSYARISG